MSSVAGAKPTSGWVGKATTKEALVNAHEKLEKIAEGIHSDVQGQAEADELDLDTGYDLWTEELRDANGVRREVGVIDMGECYQCVYVWDGKDWHEDHGWGDPYEVIERIIRVRDFNRGR